MKVFRFMSQEEFDKYNRGELLCNRKQHTGFTDSIGFCFMNTKDFEAEDAYMFLSGIVSSEVCAIFETDKKLTKSCGQYADPYGSFWGTFTATEYCTEEYSKQDFKLIEYCNTFDYFKDFGEDTTWKWKTEVNYE